MEIKDIKQAVLNVIDANRNKIIEIGENIRKNAELGFKEFKSSQLVKEEFSKLNLIISDNIAITGVKGLLKGARNLATVAIIGELDAVKCQAHPDANQVSGAAHVCGHNAQIASMIGSAIGLNAVKDFISGNVAFFAVPAEEYIELDYRSKLVEDKKLAFMSGKQELIKYGAFDDIDMAMMVHAIGDEPHAMLHLYRSSLGFVTKKVTFLGKEAHAASSPHDGVNALNAATAAIICINSQRETFVESDKTRVHFIITNGGENANTVPAKITMELYVRGATTEAIEKTCIKVDRAIRGASYAVGAEVTIEDDIGYLPLVANESLNDLFAKNCIDLIGKKNILKDVDMVASTDMGDLSQIIPCIQPAMGGFLGGLHSKDFTIIDKEQAYIIPAKAMAMTVIDLLADDAECALSIKNKFRPNLIKKQ